MTADEEKEIIGAFRDWSLLKAMDMGSITYFDFLRVIRKHVNDKLELRSQDKR